MKEIYIQEKTKAFIGNFKLSPMNYQLKSMVQTLI